MCPISNSSRWVWSDPDHLCSAVPDVSEENRVTSTISWEYDQLMEDEDLPHEPLHDVTVTASPFGILIVSCVCSSAIHSFSSISSLQASLLLKLLLCLPVVRSQKRSRQC